MLVQHNVDEKLMAWAQDPNDAELRMAARRAVFAALQDAPDIPYAPYATLLKMAKEYENGEERGLFLAQLLRAPDALAMIVREGELPEVWKGISESGLSGKPMRSRCYLVLDNRRAVKSLVEAGMLESVVAFLKRSGYSDSLLPSLYLRAAVVRRLVEKRGADGFMDLLEEELSPQSRIQFLPNLASAGDPPGLLVEQGQLPRILEMALQASDPEMPGVDVPARLLPSILSLSAVSQWLVKNDRLAETWTRLCEGADDQRKIAFAKALFGPTMLETVRSQGEQAAVVWKVVRNEKSDAVRAELLKQLVSDSSFVAWLLKRHDFSSLRSEFGEPRLLFDQPLLLAALLERGDFEAIWKTADAIADPAERTRSLGRLLCNATGVTLLEKSGRLQEVWKIVGNQSADESLRQSCLEIVENHQAVASLVEAGMFDSLAEFVRRDKRRGYWLSTLYAQRSVVQFLVKSEGGADRLFKLLDDDLSGPWQARWLQQLSFDGTPLIPLVEQGRLPRILEMTFPPRDPAAPHGEPAAAHSPHLLGEPEAVGWLLADDHLAETWTRLSAKLDAPRRISLAKMLFSSPVLKPAVSEKNLGGAVWKIAENEKNDAVRLELLKRLVSEPSFLDWLLERHDSPSLRSQLRDPRLLFDQPALLAALLARGEFEAIWKEADALTDPAARTRAFGRLLSDATAVSLLDKSGRLEEVWTRVASDVADASKSAVRVSLLGNPAAVRTLTAYGRYDSLAVWAGSPWTPLEARAAFFTHPAVVRHLLARDGDAGYWKVVTGQLPKTEVPRFDDQSDQVRPPAEAVALLDALLARDVSLVLLVDRDQLDSVLDFARASRTSQLSMSTTQGYWFCQPAVLKSLLKKKQFASVVIRLYDWDSPEGKLHVANIFERESCRNALADPEHRAEFWKLVTNPKTHAAREKLLPVMLQTPSFADWAAKQQAAETPDVFRETKK